MVLCRGCGAAVWRYDSDAFGISKASNGQSDNWHTLPCPRCCPLQAAGGGACAAIEAGQDALVGAIAALEAAAPSAPVASVPPPAGDPPRTHGLRARLSGPVIGIGQRPHRMLD